MTTLANKFSSSKFEPETLNFEPIRRILDQMARELLLAESSDWAFQIYQGTTVEYSSRRFQSHIQRFDLLANMLETGEVNGELLTEIERRDNIFSEIDFRVYGSLETPNSK